MLRIEEFTEKITRDFKMEFPEVEVKEKYIRLGTGVTHAELPIASMYKEYQVADYESVKKLYIDIAYEVLNQYKFKVDYNNVFPLLKSRDFGKGEKDLRFCREQAFTDIDTLYVSDEGEVFRFVLESDDVDFDKIKKRAWENLNKLSNILVRLDDTLNIFCLRYSTDYNASFLLSDSLQKQIKRKVGKDYLFAIPSSTALVVAKYQPEYIKIMESLIMVDKDPNKVSDKVYQYKDGKFDIAFV
ncbi:Uncharacterized protein YtpQ, UPF0354 family [Proteiniborus ethanoligenes]|uniref:Uncharacterized protein YtpQ, UPF0354 family n=1 Tax=Proteiniborus ethanoligenes TaxID=415015 RepID=A0A1H3PIF0_9FIRM|nr:DUF1444 family protein [Proteiniborus ethanoligenes]SDZ00169.1 Uncharacterized protein YtpQ, UPF0354 family [Proteiniborus ethanoligenes]